MGAKGKILVCLWIRSFSMILCDGVVRMYKEADLMNVKVLQQAVRNVTHSSQAVRLWLYLETAEDAWECCVPNCVLWWNQRYSELEYTFRWLYCSYGIEILTNFCTNSPTYVKISFVYESTFGFLISNFRRVLNVVCFLWVILRRLKFICRRFGILYLFHLHRQVVCVEWTRLGTCLGYYTGKGWARKWLEPLGRRVTE
jgi:hypothetical protein